MVSPEFTNKFKNILTKVRNKVVGDRIAWDELQGALSFFVEGYPNQSQEYNELIKDVFVVSRYSFFANTNPEIREFLIETVIKNRVSDEQMQLLIKPINFLKIVFGENLPGKKK